MICIAAAQPDFCFGWGTTIGIARNLCWGPDNRDAEGIEGEGNGEGCPPLQPSIGPGGASQAPPVGSGAEPRPKTNFGVLELEKTHLIATNLLFFDFSAAYI